MSFDLHDICYDTDHISVKNFDYGMKSVFTLRQKNSEMPKIMKNASFGRAPPKNYRTQKDFLSSLPMWRYEAQNYKPHSREEFEARISEIVSRCPRFVNDLDSFTRYPENTSLKFKVQMKLYLTYANTFFDRAEISIKIGSTGGQNCYGKLFMRRSIERLVYPSTSL